MEPQKSGETKADSSPSSPTADRNPKPILRKEPSFNRWCGDAPFLGHSPTASFDGIIVEDSVDFELPLLHNDAEIEAQARNFRQRSSVADHHLKDRRSTAHFDVEIGLHPSNSRDKVDSLENPFHHHHHHLISAGSVLKTGFSILIWYIISTCLTLYNKALLGNKLGKFPAPLLMNTFHFGLQAVLSKIIVCFQHRDRAIEGSAQMTWRDYFTKVVPTALGTALDVNLSNASLIFVSVTFATMCKSASPIFLLLFAFAFRLESPSVKLLGIILIISIGVLLTVAKETEFNFWGFVFVMLAAVMSGFRWSLTQILLQKDAYGLKDPVTLMSYVSPLMAIMTLICSLVFDPWNEFHMNTYFDNTWHIMRSCLLMFIGGSLAFFMVLTEYILISATSAVTVTVAGVVKEAVTISVAVFYFHDHFSLLKGIGLITIMFGVSLFNWYKYKKFKKGQRNENGEPMSPASVTSKYVILDEIDSEDDDT